MESDSPTFVWILAKLYDEEKPIKRKDLLKKLCQASFDSMTNEFAEFSDALNLLLKAKFIESNYHDSDTFYVISEYGIIEFRKQFGNPFTKVKNNLDPFLSITNPKFKHIIKAIKNSTDPIEIAIIFCIDNAPLVLEFLKFVIKEFIKYGITST